MGTIRLGELSENDEYVREFILFLKSMTDGLDTFVETGTYNGNTAKWASEHFKEVITIEASDGNFELAKKNLDGLDNVEPILADSTKLFSQNNFIERLSDKKVVFWLDAHWSNEADHYGKNEPCPLITELSLLQNRTGESYFIIDDLRMFNFPYYTPLGSTQEHPSIRNIVLSMPDKDVVLYADAIFSLPLADSKYILSEWRKKYKKTKYDILI